MIFGLPKKIKVWNREYTIKILEDVSDNMGCQKSMEGIIEINKNQSVESAYQTLCHEISHAIMYSIAERELCGNEAFIERLGNSLHSLLIDNDFAFIKAKKTKGKKDV